MKSVGLHADYYDNISPTTNPKRFFGTGMSDFSNKYLKKGDGTFLYPNPFLADPTSKTLQAAYLANVDVASNSLRHEKKHEDDWGAEGAQSEPRDALESRAYLLENAYVDKNKALYPSFYKQKLKEASGKY